MQLWYCKEPNTQAKSVCKALPSFGTTTTKLPGGITRTTTGVKPGEDMVKHEAEYEEMTYQYCQLPENLPKGVCTGQLFMKRSAKKAEKAAKKSEAKADKAAKKSAKKAGKSQ